MADSPAQLVAQAAQLTSRVHETIGALLSAAAASQPAGAMLVLHQNAGQVGIACLGGLRLEKGAVLACFRGGRNGVPLAHVPFEALLNIAGQLGKSHYCFEAAPAA